MPVSRNNLSLALNLAAVAVGMLLLAYASVPLYRLFCEVTGYGGTPKTASALPDKIFDREITIEFNAETDPDLPWEFKPSQRSVRVRVGERGLAFYTARNLADRPVAGHAVYNVLPFKAGPYFAKIDCFCFTEQVLQAKQKAQMPVSFYIDPAIMDDPDMADVKTITLSYTFFAVKTEGK